MVTETVVGTRVVQKILGVSIRVILSSMTSILGGRLQIMIQISKWWGCTDLQTVQKVFGITPTVHGSREYTQK